GQTLLNSTGGEDIFIAKIEGSGNQPLCSQHCWLWAKRDGGSGPDMAESIAIDDSSNVYITGSFNGSTQFGADVLAGTGDTDVFVAKYNKSGQYKWSTRAGG